ncbi:AAA family ATPase [Candidatus Woesearchaeota archaeon]|nr:AAA family ATPase [Candidatus Woesearchaeota archaeon]
MKPIKPNPSTEILAARLINDLAETGSDEDLSKLDEAKLFEKYADKGDLPNRATQQFLERDKESLSGIKDKLSALLGGEKEDDLASFEDPRDVKKYLDRFVEGQDEPKKALAVALVNYLQHGIRSGLLLLGPSGSGKTYSVSLIAKKLGIPLVKKSLANVTTEGFKGQNLSEGLEDLIGVEQGILFLDEFDKIASNDEFEGFGPQLQNELLAYFTGEKIKLNVEPRLPPGAEEESDEATSEKSGKVTVYSLPTCPACVRLKNYLGDKGINFEDIDVSEDSKAGNEIMERTGQNRFPVSEIDGKLIVGFDQAKIESALGKKAKKTTPKKAKKSNEPKEAKIYGLGQLQQYNGGYGNQGFPAVQSYIQSITQYFAQKGIRARFVDVNGAFERTPQEVKRLIDQNEGSVGYNRRRPRESQNDLGTTLVLDIDGINGYFINPSREELEDILNKMKEPEETPEEEPEETPEDNTPKKDKKKKPEPTNIVDLSKILIIAAGAFHGGKRSPSLYKIIQKRLGGNTCKLDETELLAQVQDRDLIEYGLKPELVGRLTSRTVLKPHDVEGLYRILKYNEDSPRDQLIKSFEKMGITVHFDDPALLLLAQYAHEGIGVRGIQKVLEELTKDISFNRADFAGRTINFTKSDLEKKLKKQVEFEKRDKYEIDWFDIGSIMGYLDLFVPDQREAKEELAKAFHLYHVKRNSKDLVLPMSNVLLVGPTGSGKTYMVNLLAKKAGLPIASTNATGKVPESFSGTPLAEVFEQFSQDQKDGIVYIDELDKVLMNEGNPLNNELIGFLENGEVRGRKTENYLFITSGAFQDIYKIKKSRGDESPLSREDLIGAGVREEILGRIPILVNVAPPTLETMIKVLEGPDSFVTQYANYFTTRGYKLELEDGVINLIAEYGMQSNLGFRSLKPVCGKLFGEYMINMKKYLEGETIKVKLDNAEKILGGAK